MIVQHGVIVAAWGDVTHKSNLHSCRKSLLNALIGIAAAQGKINLDDSLEKLGIDDNPPALTAEEKHATVRELQKASGASSTSHANWHILRLLADGLISRGPRFIVHDKRKQ